MNFLNLKKKKIENFALLESLWLFIIIARKSVIK